MLTVSICPHVLGFFGGNRAWDEDNKRRMAKLAELQGRLEKEAGDTGGEGGTDEEGDEEDEEEDDDDDRGSRASGKSVAPCRVSCEWPTVEDAFYPCTRKGGVNRSGGKRYEYANRNELHKACSYHVRTPVLSRSPGPDSLYIR